jgi:hypothetical protein
LGPTAWAGTPWDPWTGIARGNSILRARNMDNTRVRPKFASRPRDLEVRGLSGTRAGCRMQTRPSPNRTLRQRRRWASWLSSWSSHHPSMALIPRHRPVHGGDSPPRPTERWGRGRESRPNDHVDHPSTCCWGNAEQCPARKRRRPRRSLSWRTQGEAPRRQLPMGLTLGTDPCFVYDEPC